MVAEAAYYRAEARGFSGGNLLEDWLEAEREIDSRYTVDFSKAIVALDPAEMLDNFKKALGAQHFSDIDFGAVVEAQRESVEALLRVNRLVFDGASGLVGRQAQILHDTMDEVVRAIKALPDSGSPTKILGRQAEILSRSMAKSLANMRTLAELIAESNANAFRAVNERIEDRLAEIGRLSGKRGN